MKYLILVILPLLIGCQRQEDVGVQTLGLEAEETELFVSDDPCGWDDPNVFHVLDAFGPKFHFAKWWFSTDPEIFVQFSIQGDGVAYVRYLSQTADLDYAGTWERVAGECLIEITQDGGGLLIALGNPTPVEPIDGAGFHDAILFGSQVPGLADGYLDFANGHPGNWD